MYIFFYICVIYLLWFDNDKGWFCDNFLKNSNIFK